MEHPVEDGGGVSQQPVGDAGAFLRLRALRHRYHSVENALRPFVVGRKNWLFCDTVAGAHPSARLYTLVETAKAPGLDPYAYLRHVFTQLPKAQSLAEIEALLPTRIGPATLARDSLQGSFPTARQQRRLRGA